MTTQLDQAILVQGLEKSYVDLRVLRLRPSTAHLSAPAWMRKRAWQTKTGEQALVPEPGHRRDPLV